ncbi:hypothetical protein F4805DRAFT_42369 [Annulohypoxylon moriforme]|nr:hypothetical protein F4805DRAFT_42369 [Annulohypoxylon moriforme]
MASLRYLLSLLLLLLLPVLASSDPDDQDLSVPLHSSATSTSSVTSTSSATLISIATSTSLVAYIPECAQDCILQSINGTCTGPGDAQCLCNNMRTIGFGSVSCASTACNNSTEEIATELRSGYTQYCSAAGVSVASSATAIPSFAWGGSGSGWGAATTTASSSTHIAATGEADSSANASASASGGGGGLGTGAIAGIAVGGAIGVISITGGLLLLAFRLGRNHSSRKKDGASPSGQQEGGDGDPKPDSSANDAVAADKAQLEGKPLSELPTEYTLSGFDPIKELPTQERPAELSADPLPRYADETPVLGHTPGR